MIRIVTRAACYNYIVNGALKKSCYLVASARKLIKKYKKPATKTWLSEDGYISTVPLMRFGTSSPR